MQGMRTISGLIKKKTKNWCTLRNPVLTQRPVIILDNSTVTGPATNPQYQQGKGTASSAPQSTDLGHILEVEKEATRWLARL